MTDPHSLVDNDEDPRVFEVVQEYLQQIEAGGYPNRTELAAKYPELTATIEPYLDAIEMLHQARPNLRDSGNLAADRSVAKPLAIGQPLGDFQLVRQIGRGGMGVVYEAIQLSLSRKVAVKVLPFAAALDARQLQRFRNEAQAAAALHHAHIVPVYGIGHERGVHFYVMQLIAGNNLASLIDRMRLEALGKSHDGYSDTEILPPSEPAAPQSQIETGPTAGAELTTRRVHQKKEYFRSAAKMIAQAADALDYAHSLGIVHRDVKPANILVDESGSIWVADFGLAQIQTDHGLTHTGDLLGTLRYMSPEQAAGRSGQIDHRTDVYSLGATLYELLTLRSLFEADNRQSLLCQILENEPRSLRSCERSIPKELETITLKALAKSPSDRYASAREMCDDLQRYLSDLPIRARKPTLLERVSKWGRRHRGIVIAAVSTLALLVAGLTIAVGMTASAYQRERVKAAEAAKQFDRAEQNFQQARAAVDEFTRIAEESLTGHPMMESARIRMLQSALAYYQTFIEQHRNEHSLQVELEESMSKVEQILDELYTIAGAGKYILLLHPEVERELDLTQPQIATIRDFDMKWRALFRDFGGNVTRTAREQQRLVLAREQDAAIRELLSEAQEARFQQLVWQDEGPRALEDQTLADQLQLSTAQRAEIRRLLAEYPSFRMGPPRHLPPGPEPPFAPEGAHFPRPNGPPPPGHDRFSQASSEILEREFAKILTQDQQTKWKQLLGEPLTLRNRSDLP
ncbi:serine/threonine protein kinase [Pirellula staleyi DSM 6068]|uniref:non-specific serine/threonine protein kinase n=1 Tax=Pirellula staleyi (strain ATCC 27377 / DSM 6068 / ICPB 4128) TaxID=530564 RepID=D2QYF3_PIRSD|nr:serine/threonine-protein kinase [Pirellula staleyi]ADB18112.1 serine/threonine protein kinase [Pirellula staleyi DSM 6068]